MEATSSQLSLKVISRYMSSAWLSSDSGQDSDAFSDRFWSRHREELAAGKFWADHIKEYRDKPSERLRFAIENLPLPGAFREAAVALRWLIKAKKKRNEPFSGDVACLYWLAAIASFSMPYNQRLAEPGFNVLQSIPGTVVASLSFTYRQFGHQRLSLGLIFGG